MSTRLIGTIGRTALPVVVLAVFSAVPAFAVAPTLVLAPTSVPRGGVVHVSGTCQANTSGYAISRAFLHDATHDFAGVGAAPFSTNASGAFAVDALVPASITPGSYTVTARCGGGNLGLSDRLTVTAPGGTPTGVPAGSGGFAATRSGSDVEWLAAGVVGLAVAGVGTAGLARARRDAHH